MCCFVTNENMKTSNVKMHENWRKPQGLTATMFLEGKRL